MRNFMRNKESGEAPSRVAELELLNWMLISVRERCDQLAFDKISKLLALAQSEMAARIADVAPDRTRRMH
jgi:hypothetical protein